VDCAINGIAAINIPEIMKKKKMAVIIVFRALYRTLPPVTLPYCLIAVARVTNEGSAR
jgi:hypothetical protein